MMTTIVSSIAHLRLKTKPEKPDHHLCYAGRQVHSFLNNRRELSGIKGGWIRKVELEQQLQHLYCCSDTDVLCYNMDGKPLFKLLK